MSEVAPPSVQVNPGDAVLELDLWADVICPWCYLGHVRLSTAIEQLGLRDQVRIRFRAFLLDPSATSTPGNLRATIEHKYGPGAFDLMTTRLTRLGEEDGITYRFDRALRVSTVDAHRLIQWTQAGAEQERTEALADELHRAYFSDGRNVADHAVLAELAERVGVGGDAVREMLATDDFIDVVRSDHAEAVEMGVTGVPAIAYSGAVIIPGAQDLDTMRLVLSRVHSKVTAQGLPRRGDLPEG
jgi:predicted DsbA family dithiol-disulfide isomerase